MNTPCILWEGATVTTHKITYGISGKYNMLAHRTAYEKAKGKIPEGFVIDHLCRNGLCINPEHLEAVTNKTNILRGYGAPAINARRTHCKNGHEFNAVNTYYRADNRRICRICTHQYNVEVRPKLLGDKNKPICRAV